MSEKKLRDLAKAWTLTVTGSEEPGWADAFDQALADEPDVVRVMRFIVDRVCDDNPNNHLTLEHAWALGYLKRWIEETFHVRLTDDGGYEYTEPGCEGV